MVAREPIKVNPKTSKNNKTTSVDLPTNRSVSKYNIVVNNPHINQWFVRVFFGGKVIRGGGRGGGRGQTILILFHSFFLIFVKSTKGLKLINNSLLFFPIGVLDQSLINGIK